MSKRKDKNKKENSSKSEKFIPRITKTRYIKNGSPITKKTEIFYQTKCLINRQI